MQAIKEACIEAIVYRGILAGKELALEAEWRAYSCRCRQRCNHAGMFRGRLEGKAGILVAGINAEKVLPLLVLQYNISRIV